MNCWNYLAEDARLVGPFRGAREIPAVRQGPVDRDVHLCCPARRRAGIIPDLPWDKDLIAFCILRVEVGRVVAKLTPKI